MFIQICFLCLACLAFIYLFIYSFIYCKTHSIIVYMCYILNIKRLQNKRVLLNERLQTAQWWLLGFYDSAHINDDDCRSGSLPEVLQYRV